jgi:TonB family protein
VTLFASRAPSPSRHRGVRVRSALVGLLVAASSTTAAAQPAPEAPPPGSSPETPPDRGDVSVPRGGAGAIIKPPAEAPPAPAPGKPTMPRPKNYVPPPYPPEAEKQGLEGSVTLQLDVDKQGRVTKAVVVEGAGHGFDESAVEAAQKLDFEPARRADGTPFAARILYRYQFTLKAKEPPPDAPEKPAVVKERLAGKVLAGGEAAIAGATVTVDGKELRTGEDGAFAFDEIGPGKHRVIVSAPGFEPLTVDEEVAPGESTEVLYRLVERGGGLEVTVRGARPPREVVKRTLEKREIERIPGTNGDALKSIQNLPGVARPPIIAGLLIVRGSAPQDTQTFIDGTPVPLIYHFGGLSSVVPTELLEKIDFYPGNFSTQYGRVQGGIVDAGLRSPKDDGKYHGMAQVDLIDARALAEGPVPFLKNVTFAAAARRSYVDAWLGPTLSAAGAGVTQAPVYYDYQILSEARLSSSSKLRVGFFGSDDALELIVKKPSANEPGISGNIGLHTAFMRVQARYENQIDDKNTVRGVLALGKDNIDFGLGAFYFKLNVYSLTGRLEWAHKLAKGLTLDMGADVFSGPATVNLRLPALPRPGEPSGQPFSTRPPVEVSQTATNAAPAAYVELEMAPTSRARIVPGLRVDYTDQTGRVDVSPRVNARYDIVQGFPRTTAKAGVGMFHQPPQFQESAPNFGTPGLKSNRAIHYALGGEQELTRHVEVSLEGFYKQLDDLVVGQVGASSAGTTQYANTGTGYVVGSELLLKYKPDDRFFGWVAYTLSRSARTDRPGEAEHLYQYDQTHILTVLGSYKLGDGWEVGARFRLVSGNLITPNVCNASDASCSPTRTNALFYAPSNTYTAIPAAQPFSERLPLFHQLDVRLDKRWKFKSWQLSAYLDVQNVYNHGNAEGLAYSFNFTTRQYVNGLPLLPSIGLRGDF